MRHKRLLGLAVLATLLGMGHHLDHAVRGNHVGWPLTGDVTPFTYSFGFYPLILAGFYLLIKGKDGPGFWAVLTGGGVLFVGPTHFGPFAVEPPEDIVGVYASPIAGWAALGLLVAFLVVLACASLYGAHLWARRRAASKPGGSQAARKNNLP